MPAAVPGVVKRLREGRDHDLVHVRLADRPVELPLHQSGRLRVEHDVRADQRERHPRRRDQRDPERGIDVGGRQRDERRAVCALERADRLAFK